ncbi:DUF982 domain-containing protein [Rhizobium sp. LC145]|uniref:DUF982 domain-containing protein n=1 Tax=Rhizobium sp. LC145 TaxID=1120688 RepID=UPI0009E547DB|nr:DUF982 domain-containing protein [Rhizobium sp. LC145]TKT45340.1 DUF982 domain-containing protein [Rhizobiaceae bacterium LC148]
MQTPWKNPVVILIGDPPTETIIATTQGAALVLIEDWPLKDGPALRRALLMCAGVLEQINKPDEAREAFMEAAREAGVLVEASIVATGSKGCSGSILGGSGSR